ncbi:BolA family protein [Roseateles paludis]|jgi:BolA protein|uniref:BolA family protein n=1 Tax=Roseateles paludis TaxID=3145238 RepID=A0ABV0G594_9BURK
MTLGTVIETRLRAEFAPLELTVRDDSADHAGHAGAREGGHFHVTVVSSRFTGLQRVARHRLVYHCLSDLMQRGIHALSLDTRTPDEH